MSSCNRWKYNMYWKWMRISIRILPDNAQPFSRRHWRLYQQLMVEAAWFDYKVGKRIFQQAKRDFYAASHRNSTNRNVDARIS